MASERSPTPSASSRANGDAAMQKEAERLVRKIQGFGLWADWRGSSSSSSCYVRVADHQNRLVTIRLSNHSKSLFKNDSDIEVGAHPDADYINVDDPRLADEIRRRFRLDRS